MSTADVDAYIEAQPEPQRVTLNEMRRRILSVIPQAEQVMSYGMPGFRMGGKVIAGIAGFKRHVSYFPHSGSVRARVPRAEGFAGNKGTIQHPIDAPLDAEIIRDLIEAKCVELAESGWVRP